MGYLKLAGGLFAALLLASLIAWGKIGWSNYHSEQAKLQYLVQVVADVSGVPKLKVKDSPAAVRRIGADRDTYYGNWQGAKTALTTQTGRVVELGAETLRLRAEADQANALAAKLAAQRDGWMKRAAQAATRTRRLSDLQEARECEESMDALRAAGF
jgi:hypothetical protein